MQKQKIANSRLVLQSWYLFNANFIDLLLMFFNGVVKNWSDKESYKHIPLVFDGKGIVYKSETLLCTVNPLKFIKTLQTSTFINTPRPYCFQYASSPNFILIQILYMLQIVLLS